MKHRGIGSLAVAAMMMVVVAGAGTVALGLSGSADAAPVQPTPAAECGPGSDPETAEQGRVPAADYASGRVDRPYTCNTRAVSHFEGTGGFKVFRYVDDAGRECAYYDSNLIVGVDLLSQIETGQGPGVVVLDMSDPANPTKTTNLITPAMLSPHESLELHEGRGLLVAAMGTAATLPGIIDVYDVSQDCRDPQLLATSPFGFLGHESGMAPDGMTFYVSATAAPTIVAVDLTNASLPLPIAVLNRTSHGMNVSEDGNRLYTTPLDIGAQVLPAGGLDMNSGMAILDVSSIQGRELPLQVDLDLDLPLLNDLSQVETVSELAYPGATIAQTAIPVSIGGTAYAITIDEFVKLTDFGDPLNNQPGIGRIIDISDERNPEVISTLQLEVHQADVRPGLSGDPGAGTAFQSYAGHYCSVPQRVDPGIVACSFILSGLRIFDIADPHAPREVAYFNAGRGNAGLLGADGAPYAMSAPAFVPERCEIWYTDVNSGFWAVEVTNGAWCPASDGSPVADNLEPTPSEAVGVAELPRTGTRVPIVAAIGGLLAALIVLGAWRRRSPG